MASRCWPAEDKRGEKDWQLRLATNKTKFFKYKWLKGSYAPTKNPFSCYWSLPKKHIPRAVDRNRLRRWGRENLRTLCSSNRNFKPQSVISAEMGVSEELQNFSQIGIRKTGHLRLAFLPAGREFYRNLPRKEFDHVFFSLLEKTSERSG